MLRWVERECLTSVLSQCGEQPRQTLVRAVRLPNEQYVSQNLRIGIAIAADALPWSFRRVHNQVDETIRRITCIQQVADDIRLCRLPRLTARDRPDVHRLIFEIPREPHRVQTVEQ